ncbi:MAG: translation initiation factor IF-2, partial [Myxococcales bacterium]|nr:translation initiation factor IF-2 [Myxococcales bacterium]
VLDVDTATLIAEEFSFTVENRGFDLTDYVPDQESTDEDLEPRPPVVTIMGHVDHGKTSLLDYIRKTKVAAGEAGGITQHIGAYMVEGNNGRVTFLDTPGHEAFTAMRARGADVTDIVILVVAADDGVMPQTTEAISHAREAGVPIIVAINKIDKPNARLDMVLNQLAERGLTPEEWGGDTIVCKVSAHTGAGIDQLIEMLALQSDVLELKANYRRPARGVVIESQLDKGRGPVATVLINDGVLKVGDYVVSGTAFGRVRALNDFAGRRIQSAGPAEPVEVLGLSGVANASEPLYVVEDEKKARTIVNHRQMKEREKQLVRPVRASLQDLFQQIQAGETEQLKIILKADVQGSVEALTAALKEIHHADVELKIIHEGVGGITDSDINLASASNAIVIGFNVRTEASAKAIADQEGVNIKIYNVIYDVLDDVKKGMEGLLEPTIEEKDLGRAEIREVFSTPKAGNIAGCMVLSGSVRRGGLARLYRDNVRIWEGKIGSLRRFKNDAREVQEGYECGIGLDGYNDIKVGDIIETFERIEVAQRIN